MLNVATVEPTVWWKEMARQVPALTVLAVIVYVFLAHLEKRNVALQEITTRQHELNVQILDRSNRVIDEASDVIEENSKVLGQVLEAMRAIKQGG